MFTTRTVAAPHRYSTHFPEPIVANTLAEAIAHARKSFGEPASSRIGSYDQMRFGLSDRALNFYAEGGRYVGVSSLMTTRVQALFRPCSGYAGQLTATGTATGFIFNIPPLYLFALASAHASFVGLWKFLSPMVCTPPCFCLPIPPVVTAVTIVGAGFLRCTITVDVTAPFICL